MQSKVYLERFHDLPFKINMSQNAYNKVPDSSAWYLSSG